MKSYCIQLIMVSLTLSACSNQNASDSQTQTNNSDEIITEIVADNSDILEISNNDETDLANFVFTPNFSDSLLVYKQMDTTYYKRLIKPEETEQSIEEAYETQYTTISFRDSLWYVNHDIKNASNGTYTLVTQDQDSIVNVSQSIKLDSFSIFVGKTIGANDLTADYIWVFKADAMIFSTYAKQYDSCEYSEQSLNAIIKNEAYSAIAIEETYGDITLVNLNNPDDIQYYVSVDYDPTAYRP